MLSVIKSWGWYDWVKHALAVALVLMCVLVGVEFAGGIVFMG